MPPQLAVVIPTHNREQSLRRLLDALAAQTAPADAFEVVVVADGCVDGTAAMVEGYECPYELTLVQTPGGSAAAARNRGGRWARAPLLAFLDDDIEPAPTLVEAFLAEHEREPGRLLLGRSEPAIEPLSFFEVELRRWWRNHITAMARPDHRFDYRDMHAGNFSIARDTFWTAGGFDEAFPGCGGEDYELGARLLAAGIQFAFVWSAVGAHFDDTDLRRSFGRAFQEGRADVLIAERHPHLRPTMPVARGPRRRPHLLPARLRDCIDRLAIRLLAWGGLRGRALARYGRARRRWYLRGVRFQEEAGGGAHPLSPSPAPRADVLELDLAAGLPAARRQLDDVRPRAARLHYRRHEVGAIPPQPGAEPLRGVHLAPALAHEPRYLAALAADAVLLPPQAGA